MATKIKKMNINPMRPFLDNPGEPPVEWSKWSKQFQVYLIASGMNKKAHEVQVAILLHSLGTEGQRIFYTLPGASDDKLTLDAAVKLLNSYFIPKTNIISNWVKFISIEQTPGQTINNFVSCLREQAALCDFGTFEDRMVHVMIGARALDARIRTALLQEDDSVPLERVIEKANILEAAARDVQTNDKTLRVPTEKNVQAVKKTPGPGNNFQNDTCFSCSKKGHRSGWSGCPAKDKLCNFCKKRGHFSSACRSKKFSQDCEPTKRVQNVCVYSVHDGSSEPEFTSVRVEGTKVDLLIDSGSQLTIFPHELYIIVSIFLYSFN